MKIEPMACLEDAMKANLRSVAVVGIARNGRMIVWGNDGRTFELLERAPKHIDSLAAA